MGNINYGLNKPRKDRRDFSRSKKFGSLGLGELPLVGLGRPDPPLRDQGRTFFCTGYTGTAMRCAKFGIEFSPDWFISQEVKIEGWRGEFRGASLRTQARVIRRGALPQKDAPFLWQRDGDNVTANPRIWPSELDEKAKPYKARAAFTVDGPHDTYDNIRVALKMNDKDGEGVSLGMDWFAEWTSAPHKSVLVDPTIKISGPHNVRVYDWNENGLVVESHTGKIHILPRHLANRYIYTNEGPYIFVDDTDPDAVKAEQWGVLENIKDWLMKLYEWVRTKNFKDPAPVIDFDLPAPVPTPEPTTPEKPADSESVKEMCMRVCREEALSSSLTEQVIRTIECESGFDPKAINKNTNGTTDYGICQFNDYWYIGKDKPIPSVEVALNDPEFCVRVMCKQFKAGRASDWICHRKIYG